MTVFYLVLRLFPVSSRIRYITLDYYIFTTFYPLLLNIDSVIFDRVRLIVLYDFDRQFSNYSLSLYQNFTEERVMNV